MNKGVSLPLFRLRRKPAARATAALGHFFGCAKTAASLSPALDGMPRGDAPPGAARFARVTQSAPAGHLRFRGADPTGRSWPAPAKINLFLHVTGRRADGYHEIQTLFQLLDWGDEVRIQPTADGRIIRERADYAVPAAKDLVLRAAQLLQAATNSACGCRIEVIKRVPLGSGLGGGSSDAATVLLVLNRLWNCGLDLRTLAALGTRLGADVPVFVHGRTALAAGIGDRLQDVELGRRHYVLVFPPLSIATGQVFTDPDLVRDSSPISLADARAGRGRNDCEAVVLKRFPVMAEAFRRLQRWGRPRLTGTGSTIFMRMDGEAQANRTAREIKTLYNVRAVSGVDRSPLHELLDEAVP